MLILVRPNPNPALTAMTPNESNAYRRDQNFLGGFISATFVLCGSAQRRNGRYIRYAQTKATIDPRTPPNPSSRSGFASTNKRLPKPSAAQIIDQNDAGNVIRSAANARSADFLPSRPASVCQLNVM